MLKLWSADYSALVLARAILKQEPKVSLQIYLGGERQQDSHALTDLRMTALEAVSKDNSRVAVISDITEDLVLPENVVSIQTEMLSEFVNRGLADTVEFRRLARKYLRAVRNNNCPVALFFSGVLADEKAQKILSHILGSQVKPVFLTEFLPEDFFIPADKQSIEIFTSENLERVHAEAEKFLHTKLAKTAVKNFAV